MWNIPSSLYDSKHHHPHSYLHTFVLTASSTRNGFCLFPPYPDLPNWWTPTLASLNLFRICYLWGMPSHVMKQCLIILHHFIRLISFHNVEITFHLKDKRFFGFCCCLLPLFAHQTYQRLGYLVTCWEKLARNNPCWLINIINNHQFLSRSAICLMKFS